MVSEDAFDSSEVTNPERPAGEVTEEMLARTRELVLALRREARGYDLERLRTELRHRLAFVRGQMLLVLEDPEHDEFLFGLYAGRIRRLQRVLLRVDSRLGIGLIEVTAEDPRDLASDDVLVALDGQAGRFEAAS